MSDAQANEAEKNIEIWKVKKLIKRLEAARGNGTSMISLIIPPKDQVSRAAKMLAEEYGTASNIKSRVNRQSVLSAITSTQQRLKLYNKVPPNGLVVYCGEILTSEGKERKVNIDFEPFKPINTSLYLCDNKFHTEALAELLESDQKFGFIIMDGNGALFGTLSGNTRDVVHKFSVDLPKKHGRGGQSALRFARLREEKRHNYVRKVAELAVQNFITADKVNVAGLILAGSADFKNDLNQSDLFDNRLATKVIKVVAETSSERYKLLLSCPSGLLPSQVSVVFDGDYDRIPHPDINLENSVSEIWDQRVHKNPSLYNGTKFRYGKHVWHDGGGSNQEPHVCLHLGLTDYRNFVGTNLNNLWESFLVASEDDAIRCQHTSSPLGNGAIVETSDKKILVLQRSNNVGEFPGHFVFPGGHPEPQEVGLVSHHHEDLTDSKVINDKVSQEMFDSIVREVVEEIGVPSASLHEQVFIGISRRVLNVRPTAFFFMKCSLSSKEVQKLYATAQDSFESTQLFTVPLIDLENMASKMPGCHEGGLALYKLMVEAVKNV